MDNHTKYDFVLDQRLEQLVNEPELTTVELITLNDQELNAEIEFVSYSVVTCIGDEVKQYSMSRPGNVQDVLDEFSHVGLKLIKKTETTMPKTDTVINTREFVKEDN